MNAHRFRLAVLVCIALLLPMFAPTAAQAAVTYEFAGGVLTITGTVSGDSLWIACPSGNVEVFGDDTGTACADVTELAVIGRAGGDDIQLGDTSKSDFPALVSTMTKGGGGDESFAGSFKRDVFVGGSGGDDVWSSGGIDVLSGGKGNDTVNFWGTNPMVDGSLLVADDAKAKVDGFETLELRGSDGDDVIDGSGWPGRLTVRDGNGNDTAIGSPGNDTFYVQGGNDVVRAGRGNDQIQPGGGTDTLNGGRGADYLYTTASSSLVLTDELLTIAGSGVSSSLVSIEDAHLAGNSLIGLSFDLSGWSHPSRVSGSAGPDTIVGGSGPDLISGYLGDDTIDGNGGQDTLWYPSLGGAGTLTLGASTSTDTSHGTDSFSDMEKAIIRLAAARTVDAFAFAGSIAFYGSSGADSVGGAQGDDVLYGKDGDDSLTGNGGSDTIDGGKGSDFCSGESEVNCEI